MDIAKIRKRAKEQGAEKRSEEPAVAPAAEGGAAPLPAVQASVPPTPAPEVTEGAGEAPAGPVETEKPPPQPETRAEAEGEIQIELLTFRLASEEFAFRVEEVEEILRLQKITQVPTMPSYMVGITSLRGKIIPVIDLKARLNLGRLSEGAVEGSHAGNERSAGKILIIAGPEGLIGAVIDRVMGVVRIGRHEVLEPPAHLTEAEKRFIEGIVILDKRFISVVRSGDTMDIEIG